MSEDITKLRNRLLRDARRDIEAGKAAFECEIGFPTAKQLRNAAEQFARVAQALEFSAGIAQTLYHLETNKENS